MNHRRWPVAVAVLGLLLGSGAFFALRDRGHAASGAPLTPSEPAALAPPSAPLPSAAQAATGARPRSFETGLQLASTLSLEQRLRMGAPESKDDATFHFLLEGTLTQTVVGLRPEQADVQFQVMPSRFLFEADGQDALDADSRPRMLAALQAPFYVTLNRQGAALSVHFERELGPVEQNLLRSLVSATQFVSPSPSPATWETQELDTTGQYVARYRAGPGERAYSKQKERYLRLASPQGLQPLGASLRITVSSETTVALGAEGWPQDIDGSERMATAADSGMPPVQGEGRLVLKRTSVRSVPMLIGALDARRAQLVRSSLATQVFARADPKEELRKLVGGAKLSDLLKELRAVPRDGKSGGPETARLMNRMRALFQLEPESAAQVPSMLRQEKDRDTYSPVLGALSSASTPQAVQALASVATDAQTPTTTRVNATAMLGMAESPTPEGTQALRELTRGADEDLRNTATLALGNVARNMDGPAASQGEALLRELQEAARAAPTPQARALWISSLSNTADVRILPFLQECLRDPLPLIRQSALEAMRLLPSQLADQLIAESLVKDTSPDVRRSAIFAASFRSLGPLLMSLGQVLRTDSVDAVRMDAVRLLGSNVVQVPMARELLTWSGINDTNGEIRHTALAFLAPPTRTPPDPVQP
ncbi:HEAT repeat domain-containing protein [Corallococcus sp. bb12-1]|uniref:HEAT repeat domain-containing protein n=1 Tax=Corallococcus sp. bb12-1 TaxID=2996784 RepID=UPI002270D974|nr:HEAT repeat domain-containing protein [Corallococcus sp. bb12-1]MCY1046234.1 HEAT repeat domain-containing protein [Corallococcus sp. bb12-1]